MADCAILAIASTTQTVRALLQRFVKDVALDEHASTVPWTIVNKYYTANVKFLVHSFSSWAPVQRELLAPALLFVWNRGEPYRDQIRSLSLHASQHEFEVALAIRLSASTLDAEIEDDQDIDIYLSSKGFEFVDVPDIEASLPDRTGIPGVPRIIDALSTIMWPSMVRQGSVRAGQSNLCISGDYHNLARLVGERISGNDGDRIRRELEELERWLDGDDADTHSIGISEDEETVPWSTAVTPGTLSPSSSGFLESSRPTTPKAGFEDDFTSFISAPSASSTSIPPESLSSSRFPPLSSANFSSTFSFDSPSSARRTPILDDRTSFDTTLVPDGCYKSLGSVSDFGDLMDKEPVDSRLFSNGSSADDEDMPSQVEITETSHKIFGGVPLSLSPAQGHNRTFQVLPTLGGVPSPSEDLDVEMTDSNLERFDLQSVFGALQGLKEEIALMPDRERRKAAAKVALGLAYGLNPRSETNDELA